VASGEALGMIHQAMRYVMHQCTAMPIEMAGKRGALFPIVDFVINHNRSYITCNSHYKLIPWHSLIFTI